MTDSVLLKAWVVLVVEDSSEDSMLEISEIYSHSSSVEVCEDSVDASELISEGISR
jgi:hypothetical protein